LIDCNFISLLIKHAESILELVKIGFSLRHQYFLNGGKM
jgi:hypothetical protein